VTSTQRPWQSFLLCEKGLSLWFLAVWTVKALGEKLVWLYSSSREKSNRWKSRSEFQMSVFIDFRRPCLCPSEGHQHGVFILSTANFSRTFRQITQQRNTIQIWDMVKLFSCVSLITLQILGFFHQLVLILWRDSENQECTVWGLEISIFYFNFFLTSLSKTIATTIIKKKKLTHITAAYIPADLQAKDHGILFRAALKFL